MTLNVLENVGGPMLIGGPPKNLCLNRGPHHNPLAEAGRIPDHHQILRSRIRDDITCVSREPDGEQIELRG